MFFIGYTLSASQRWRKDKVVSRFFRYRMGRKIDPILIQCSAVKPGAHVDGVDLVGEINRKWLFLKNQPILVDWNHSTGIG